MKYLKHYVLVFLLISLATSGCELFLTGATLTVAPTDVVDNITDEDLDQAKSVISERLNNNDIDHEIMDSATNHSFDVQLRSSNDRGQAIQLIETFGLVEFVDGKDETGDISGQCIVTTQQESLNVLIKLSASQYKTSLCGDRPATDYLSTTTIYTTILTSENIKRARAQRDEFGQWFISLDFDEHGTQVFADYTEVNVGKLLAIVFDGEIISAPRINSAITGGSVIIQGSFTEVEAQQLASVVSTQPLPFQVTVTAVDE